MATSVLIEIGEVSRLISAEHLPPVGTIIAVPKHLSDNGSDFELEVISHEWSIGNPASDTDLDFSIRIRTRKR